MKGASAAQIAEVILTPMRSVYEAPKGMVDETKALATYVAALSDYDVATLSAAWVVVVKGTKRFTWPTPGAIVDACDKVRAAKKGIENPRETRERVNRLAADDAMFSPLGRQARDEGWSLGFWEWICRHGERSAYPIEKIKAASLLRERFARGDLTEEEKANPFGHRLISFAQASQVAERMHADRFAAQDLGARGAA